MQISGLLALLLLLLPPSSQAQANASQTQQIPDDREAQYVALQADLFDKQSLAALPDAAGQIARMLGDIRTRFPTVADMRIPSQIASRTSLIISLEPRFRQNVDRLCDAWEGYARARSSAVGIPEVDVLTRKFGGAYEVTCRSRGSSIGPYVVVNFPRLLHAPSLAKLYRQAAGVTSAENDRVILGGVTPVSVRKEYGDWSVTFGQGAGDCPAGCTYREYHHFLVASDGTIQYLGPEQQGELPVPAIEVIIEEDTPEEEALPQ
jgi:hypothetical protein